MRRRGPISGHDGEEQERREDHERHHVVIAVLAVLFLREAVARAEEFDLLQLGASLALMIAALTFFLRLKGPRKA